MDMMNNDKDILGNVQGVNVYTVPEGYFNSLADEIMSSVHLATGKQSAQQGPYSIPDGYFEALPTSILARLQAPAYTSAPVDQAEHVFLDAIGKTNVYELPAHYFETLPNQLLNKVNAPGKGKVVSLRTITRKWVSYVTAAAVAGIMVVGAFLFTDNNEQVSSTYYNNGLKSIDVKKGVSDLSESEIATYLAAHPAVFDIPAPATETAEATVQRSIRNISEEEINNYLQENWEPGENPLKGFKFN